MLVSLCYCYDTVLLSPPSSVLRLNPSVLIPKETNTTGPLFRPLIPCGLAMLPA